MPDKLNNKAKAREDFRASIIDGLINDILRELDRRWAKGLQDPRKSEVISQSLGRILSLSLPPEVEQQIIEVISALYVGETAKFAELYNEGMGKSLKLEPRNIEIIDAITDLEITATANKYRAAIGDIKGIIGRSILSGRQINAKEVAANQLQLTSHQVRTELNTNLAGFQRALAVSGNPGDEQRYLYAGNLIPTSREFCIDRAGRIFTRKEIRSWDNGQGLPPELYLGGYNCRHSLLPVSDTYGR